MQADLLDGRLRKVGNEAPKISKSGGPSDGELIQSIPTEMVRIDYFVY